MIPRFGWAAMLAVAACAGQQVAPPPPEKPAEQKASAAAPPATPAPQPAPAPAETAMNADEAVIAEVELCSTCHSAELIEDSRIGEAGWKAEITKMRNWGAAVPEDKAAPFALWFTRHYPAAERPPPPRTTTTREAIAAVAPESGARATRGDKQAGAATYTRDCASCHGADAQGTGGGPVLIEAPVLYQPQRFATLTKQGKGRMPAFNVLQKADINNLIVYLRSLR